MSSGNSNSNSNTNSSHSSNNVNASSRAAAAAAATVEEQQQQQQVANDNANNENNNATSSITSNNIETELSEIEASLQTPGWQRVHQGRAAFDSVTSTLASLRSRLLSGNSASGVTGATNSGTPQAESASPTTPAATASALSTETATTTSPPPPPPPSTSSTSRRLLQRLEAAELSHSARIPLGLLQNELQRRDSNSVVSSSLHHGASSLTSLTSMGNRQSGTSNTAGAGAEGKQAESDSSGGDDNNSDVRMLKRSASSPARRASTLLASRRRLCSLQQRAQDAEIHEDGFVAMANLLPRETSRVSEGNEEEEEGENEEDTQAQVEDASMATSKSAMEDDSGHESIEVALAAPSSASPSAAAMEAVQIVEPISTTGTESAPPTATTPTSQTVVYSWGIIPPTESTRSSSITSTSSAQMQSSPSLHDDDVPRTYDVSNSEASCRVDGTSSRIGRHSIVDVAIGPRHAAVVTSAGDCLAVGDNTSGQVAPLRWRESDTIVKPSLVESLSRMRVVQVACGLTHTAALVSTGAVLSWGGNSCGQLGHSTNSQGVVTTLRTMNLSSNNRHRPNQAQQVVCGYEFTAVLTTTLEVLICGSEDVVPPQNSSKDDDESKTNNVATIPVLKGLPIRHVSAGAHHVVALTAAGIAYTWGNNTNACCARRHPEHISVPVPIIMPPTTSQLKDENGQVMSSPYSSSNSAIPTGQQNWATWNGANEPICLPPDVAIVHAACGVDSTILVTRSGSLRVCGSNRQGQLGLPMDTTSSSSSSDDQDANIISQVTAVNDASLKDVFFVQAQSGDAHSLVLSRDGEVWYAGQESSSSRSNNSGWTRLSFSSTALTIAAGGRQSVVVCAAEGAAAAAAAIPPASSLKSTFAALSPMHSPPPALKREFSVDFQRYLATSSVDDLPTRITNLCMELSSSCSSSSSSSHKIDSTRQELLTATEELFASPAIFNALFWDPSHCQTFYEKLLFKPSSSSSQQSDDTHQKLRQDITTAMEKGMRVGLESLLSQDARIIYPESVRCMLLYLQCPLFTYWKPRPSDEEEGGDNDDRDSSSESSWYPDVNFDHRGDIILSLCETFLSLPFEGYKALILGWSILLYQKDEAFSKFLLQPLLSQLERGMRDGAGARARAIPVIVALLRWFHSAVERYDQEEEENETPSLPPAAAGSIAPRRAPRSRLQQLQKKRLATWEDFHSTAIEMMDPEALYEDLRRMKMADKQQRASTFFLCAAPFLMSPRTKRNLLQIEHQVDMIRAATSNLSYDSEQREFVFEPYFCLCVDRQYLLQQTLQKISSASPTELRKSLKVIFKGEEGVDAGGVTKEFFQLLSQKLFDVSTGMWSTRFSDEGGNDEVTFFNGGCTWNNDGYYLVGVLLGLALYNSVLLDVHFPMAVYRKLLGYSLGLEDVFDEDLKHGLQQLLDYEGDDVEDVFCLTFEVTWQDLGVTQRFELKADGANIPVTSSNREEYVLLYVKWLLVDSVENVYTEFERGVLHVLEGSSLDLLRPEELELLVVGSPVLDFAALQRNCRYEGGYDESSPVVQNFWNFVQNAAPDTQVKLLKFSTGSPKAPIGGLGKMPYKIQRAGPDSMQLPTSHTCFNTLILPDYGSDREKLERLLGRAILECEGFGLQ